MKFPEEAINTEKNTQKLLEILKSEACDNCLGRQFGMLGHGLSNAERGKILRKIAGKITKSKLKEAKVCKICGNFFKEKINEVASDINKSFRGIEFKTFLIGTVLSVELIRKQD